MFGARLGALVWSRGGSWAELVAALTARMLRLEFDVATTVRGWRCRANFGDASFFVVLCDVNMRGSRAQLYFRTDLGQN